MFKKRKALVIGFLVLVIIVAVVGFITLQRSKLSNNQEVKEVESVPTTLEEQQINNDLNSIEQNNKKIDNILKEKPVDLKL